MTRKNKLYTVLVICTFFGVAAFAFAQYANSQSVGTIQSQEGLNKVKSATISLKQQNTQFFSIRISNELYQKSAVVDQSRPIYAQYMYAGTEFGSDLQLSVSLGSLSSGLLDDISYVKQRRLETGKYEVVSESAQKIEFKSVDSTEYSLFWLENSGYAAVVGSGRGDNFEKIKEIVNQAERSWEWRK